ncbi:uncharacterized protein ARMOST_18641 [Armillaria ostoyae]|uniref:Uncharacterized protein n=1 Tax=Armillaria ostoyae TaxID=47428 RepID=A0A284S2E4_ARMOS|nr:uncharacterized protein ARMOST_18641 [Armillaria ostoyae]
MFFHAFTALLAATVVASSSLATRDAGPKCTIVITPKDSSYAAGAANQLTYDLSFNDGTYTAVTAITVMSLTSDKIATIIEEQWPETWVWGDSNPRYDWYMNSMAC